MAVRDWWPYLNLRVHNLMSEQADSIMSFSPVSGSLPDIVLVGPRRLVRVWQGALLGSRGCPWHFSATSGDRAGLSSLQF